MSRNSTENELLMQALRNKKQTREPLTRSQIMSRVTNKDSAAEMSLRISLFHERLRYRLHRRTEGVIVDIVFVSARVAVFVDGCFWHGCPKHATYPKSNQSYWLPKLAENRERDKRQSAKLRRTGWRVIRVWEHDCLPPNQSVLKRIVDAVRASRLKTSFKRKRNVRASTA
jgi:DNA mismatch endonuclease (patch repair protein)